MDMGPLKVACTRKELSCIIASLFHEIGSVCEICDTVRDGDLVIGGTITGTEDAFAYIKLTDYGFDYYGDNDVLNRIRGTRCAYGTFDTPKEDGGATE